MGLLVNKYWQLHFGAPLRTGSEDLNHFIDNQMVPCSWEELRRAQAMVEDWDGEVPIPVMVMGALDIVRGRFGDYRLHPRPPFGNTPPNLVSSTSLPTLDDIARANSGPTWETGRLPDLTWDTLLKQVPKTDAITKKKAERKILDEEAKLAERKEFLKREHVKQTDLEPEEIIAKAQPKKRKKK